ncbi:unnamed protein product [Closterium sp. Naga37s-1]|nr:unnamed protein product [Closterium sp. Naga37s-1]
MEEVCVVQNFSFLRGSSLVQAVGLLQLLSPARSGFYRISIYNPSLQVLRFWYTVGGMERRIQPIEQ